MMEAKDSHTKTFPRLSDVTSKRSTFNVVYVYYYIFIKIKISFFKSLVFFGWLATYYAAVHQWSNDFKENNIGLQMKVFSLLHISFSFTLKRKMKKQQFLLWYEVFMYLRINQFMMRVMCFIWKSKNVYHFRFLFAVISLWPEWTPIPIKFSLIQCIFHHDVKLANAVLYTLWPKTEYN